MTKAEFIKELNEVGEDTDELLFRLRGEATRYVENPYNHMQEVTVFVDETLSDAYDISRSRVKNETTITLWF